jgi:hypothetical protein
MHSVPFGHVQLRTQDEELLHELLKHQTEQEQGQSIVISENNCGVCITH